MPHELKITDVTLAVQEPAMLEKALSAASRWENSNSILYVEPRRTDGWCEWMLSIDTPALPMGFYIAIIQRQPGAEVESHS